MSIARAALPAMLSTIAMLACAADNPAAGDASNMPPPTIPSASPPLGQTVRVGGDLNASITTTSKGFRFGPSSIDTPLPDGYPAPTPPGAIDIKSYPSVRLAEVQGSSTPDRGMNDAFWPLFRHIKKHDIAMTSPVEMNYQKLDADNTPDAWSMAFLYRTPDLNQTGAEGNITVRDADPVTVLALGAKGDYSMSLVNTAREQLQSWLDQNPQWIPDGEWRALYYNGPALFWWNKWAEVQIPIRPADETPAS